MILQDMNQRQAEAQIKEDTIALLPIGATEVHGNHLPLGTDTYLAEGIARKVAQRIGEDKCLILPTVAYGQVWSLRETIGTIDVPDEVLTPYLVHIAMSMYRAGVRRFAFINAHVGNANAMKAAARRVYAQCDMKIYAFTYPEAEKIIDAVCTSERPHPKYFHACEIETSYMLYLYPERVDMSEAVCQYPAVPSGIDVLPTPWTDFMHTAVLGDATAATAEKGKAIIEAVIENIAAFLDTEE